MFKLCDRCLYESGFIAESTTHLINLCILHYVNSFAKFLALLLHNTSPPSKASICYDSLACVCLYLIRNMEKWKIIVFGQNYGIFWPKGDLKPYIIMYLCNIHIMSLVSVTFGNFFFQILQKWHFLG